MKSPMGNPIGSITWASRWASDIYARFALDCVTPMSLWYIRTMDRNTTEALKIANGIHELIMSEDAKRGEKLKVDVDGTGEPEVMKNAFGHDIAGEAEFTMSRFVGDSSDPKGQWIFTVTVKAEYSSFEE